VKLLVPLTYVRMVNDDIYIALYLGNLLDEQKILVGSPELWGWWRGRTGTVRWGEREPRKGFVPSRSNGRPACHPSR
jgi:hypothetical protein